MARHGLPDGYQDGKARFKLPTTPLPEPIIPGVKMWRTSDHWTVLRLHYTADPDVDQEWVDERSRGYPGGTKGRKWQREMEVSFDSYSGDPVYPRFDSHDSVHPTPYNPELELWRGWDFGFRHPAVVFLQYEPEGDVLHFLHEVYPTLNSDEVPGMNTENLCRLILAETERLFPEVTKGESPVRDFVDPSGVQHKETSDLSSIEMLQQFNIQPEWVRLGRKDRINYARHWVEEPGRMRVNPHCQLIVKAFTSAYRYPDLKSGGADREMPDLSRRVQSEPYIHLIDAFEYIVANALQMDDVLDPKAWSDRTGQDMLVGDMAEMYLRAARLPHDRTVESYDGDASDNWSDYEERLSDLIGEDDLADAWME